MCSFRVVLCPQVPYIDLQQYGLGLGLYNILLRNCSLGADDCGLTLSARCRVIFRNGFVCLGESAFPYPDPRVPPGRRLGLVRQQVFRGDDSLRRFR